MYECLMKALREGCHEREGAQMGVVKSKCTALFNWKHRRFGRIQALASACALHLTTYYHVPEYFR